MGQPSLECFVCGADLDVVVGFEEGWHPEGGVVIIDPHARLECDECQITIEELEPPLMHGEYIPNEEALQERLDPWFATFGA